MSFDAKMNHDLAKLIVENFGWDMFLTRLQMQFPTYHLYTVSTDWVEDRRFICKARGTHGDLIIGWE